MGHKHKYNNLANQCKPINGIPLNMIGNNCVESNITFWGESQ